ncbi:MAG: oxidoreductase [Planctomycetota bacterium]|nr:MAG: oxidoreductase [Planctomycetota bacterium]
MTDTDSMTAFANRLRKMHKHLAKWARRQGITCYRLYDHDLPDQPAIVDWYQGHVVVWSKRRTRDERDADDHQRVADMLAAVQEVLRPLTVVHKRRQRQQGRQEAGSNPEKGQYRKLDNLPEHKVIVDEYDLHFAINLTQYLDVGLFLDHRPTRRLIRERAAGKTVLNLFAYTGSLSIAARAGGARATTTVDLNRRYLQWYEHNAALNNMPSNPQHTLHRADCLSFIEQAQHHPQRWDMIICDPPTFSNSKSMAKHWSVEDDHAWLLSALARLLTPQGTILFSTNARGFTLNCPAHLQAQDLTAATTDKDFARRPAHACFALTAAARALGV